jgi:hypothetical protein
MEYERCFLCRNSRRPSVWSMRCRLLAAAIGVALVAAAPASSSTDALRASPPSVQIGVRAVGGEYLKGTRITNASGRDILLHVEGTRMPDDFGFGLMPGSTCPALGPALLAAGESCTAVMNFRPSEFFAGEDQLAELTATAYDVDTGAVVDTLVIEFHARGRA